MSASGEVACKPNGSVPGGWLGLGLKALAVGVVMFAVCWISIELPKSAGRSVPIWPANAVILSLLLVTSKTRWPVWLVAAWLGDFAASLACGQPVGLSIGLCCCNLVAIIVSGGALRRFVGERLDLARGDHLLKFTLIAGLAAPVVAALVAGLTLGGLTSASGLEMLGAWIAANGLGAVIITPLLLTLRDQRRLLAETPMTPRAAVALVGLALITTASFFTRLPLALLIPPALLLVVFQLEFLGAAWGVLIVLCLSLGLTALGHASALAMRQSPSDAVLVVQLFFAAIVLTSLPTASALTQRRRFQTQVADSEARYRQVTEASRDMVLEYGLDGVMRFVSQASRHYGYEPAELVGRNALSMIHVEDRAAVHARGEAMIAGVDPEKFTDGLEFRVLTAAGGYVWVEGNPSIIRDERGAPVAFTNFLRDVSKRKAMEAELRTAHEAAEAAVVVKADFLANMSHELRTPLTSVLGFTRLALQQPDLSAVSTDYIRKASNAGEALLATVNDILDFSKLESGQLQIRPEPCDAAAVGRDTLELFSEAASAKSVALRFIGDALPDRLILDPNRLRQLLLNLVGNAVKFSETGEVVVVMAWVVDGARLSVSVTDQGPGIAPEQQSLLFRRFSQVDASSTRRFGGTGLGLAICMGLVEAMGGTIGVESRLGEGARFYFDIPAALAEVEGPPEDEEALVFPFGVRILVADDHPANRELVRAVLTPFGAEVCEAENGAEAVKAAAAPFDLILMDLRMPELDGEGAMAAIRAGDGPNRAAPILAFSAGADAPGAAQRRQIGFTGDLSKPILPADLIQAVCRYAVLDRREGDWSAVTDLAQAAESAG